MGTRLLNTPFWALFNMIPFILFKDLLASPLQITSTIILKPAVSLIALYWISTIIKRRDRLLKHVVWSHALSYIPFFFFPFVRDPWFIVFAFGFYMTLYRGAIPSWMELLKLNIPGASRSRIFAFGSSCGYIGDAIWPVLLGWVLDGYNQAWQWMFPITAAISLSSILLQMRMKVDPAGAEEEVAPVTTLAKPWHQAWELLKKRRDFLRYQIGFMLGGAGVMILQPALPQFFMGTLQLTYTELGVAITLCKGVGFALSSQFWARWIHRIDIYRFAGWVTLLAAVFPICIFFSQYQLWWLYFGYILYGVMQGGSELGWNMSGPIFAQKEDSSVYTSVNVMTQGIRGCFIPALGGFLSVQTTPFIVMLAGSLLCLLAANRMALFSKLARAEGNAVSLES